MSQSETCIINWRNITSNSNLKQQESILAIICLQNIAHMQYFAGYFCFWRKKNLIKTVKALTFVFGMKIAIIIYREITGKNNYLIMFIPKDGGSLEQTIIAD